MKHLRSSAASAAVALTLGLAAPAAAQPAVQPAAPADTAVRPAESYRREVFRYQRGGRPDPFQPLLTAADLGYRVEDLRLTSIVYSPNPRQSIAVFALADGSNRFRLRAGQRLGSITIAGIYPRRVDVQVNDFGVARVQSLTLQRATRAPGPGPGAGAPGVAAPASAQQPANTAVSAAPAAPAAPAASAAPTGPLRRGGRGQSPGAAQPAATPQQGRATPGRTTGTPSPQRNR